jgi:hypothetical protein
MIGRVGNEYGHIEATKASDLKHSNDRPIGHEIGACEPGRLFRDGDCVHKRQVGGLKNVVDADEFFATFRQVLASQSPCCEC